MVGTGIGPFDGRDFGRKPNDLEIYRNGIWGGGSAIDLVVRTDVVQNYLVFGDFNAQDDSGTVGDRPRGTVVKGLFARRGGK